MAARSKRAEPKRRIRERLERLINDEDLDGAKELAEDLAQRHPQSINVAHALGAIAEKRGQFSEAAENFQAAIHRGGASPGIYTNLANMQLKLEDRAAAEHYLDKALGMREDHAPALVLKARMRRDAGRVDEAIALLDRVLGQDPQDVIALYQRASLKSLDLPHSWLEYLERVMGDEQRKIERRTIAGFALG
ncbi:tetratricopeptide repeat protein, partial [Halorhodospira sp. 9622]|uniref:tetratricopeptide repeat protein n=1 Tax=Halorhodospira sp. 9622 TaxID=2899136 RepID=UPI001EE8C929